MRNMWLYLTFQRGARLLAPEVPTDLLEPPLVGASASESVLEAIPVPDRQSA